MNTKYQDFYDEASKKMKEEEIAESLLSVCSVTYVEKTATAQIEAIIGKVDGVIGRWLKSNVPVIAEKHDLKVEFLNISGSYFE